MRLLLKEIVEGSAGVVAGTGSGAGRGLLLHPHADGIKLALVARIFPGDSFCYRLHAFEAAGRVEVGALFAGVQFESALRTSPHRLGDCSQQGSALGAAGDRVRPCHLHRARAESVFADRLLRRRPLGIAFAFFSAVLISVLAVFSRQEVASKF